MIDRAAELVRARLLAPRRVDAAQRGAGV